MPAHAQNLPENEGMDKKFHLITVVIVVIVIIIVIIEIRIVIVIIVIIIVIVVVIIISCTANPVAGTNRCCHAALLRPLLGTWLAKGMTKPGQSTPSHS